MDRLILKILGLYGSAFLFISVTYAQDVRPLPVINRRRLPSVIITREHLRQRHNSYGTYGDTAAEFVVSAGLDTSKNSAVRIRRIGNGRANATHSNRSNINKFNFSNSSGTRSNTNFRQNPEYRTPSFHDADERNGISNARVPINRRYHFSEGEQNLQAINRRFHADDGEQHIRPPNNGAHQSSRHPVLPGRKFYQYQPPLFVPQFQQNRRFDINTGVPGESIRRFPNIAVGGNQGRHPTSEQRYPIVSVKYSTSSVTAVSSPKERIQQPLSVSNNVDNMNKRIQVTGPVNIKLENHRESIRRTRKPIFPSSQNSSHAYQKEKPIDNSNSTSNLYITINNPIVPSSNPHAAKFPVNEPNPNLNGSDEFLTNNKSYAPHKAEITSSKTKEDISKRKKNNSTQDASSRNPVIELANPATKVLTEKPPSQHNIDKIREFQTRLIRKPSLILRDQITVNELPKKLSRPRFGPRSMDFIDEDHSLSRHKRQAEIEGDGTPQTVTVSLDETAINSDKLNDSLFFSNSSENNTTQRQGRYDSQRFQTQPSHQVVNRSLEIHKDITMEESEARPAPVYEMFSDGTYNAGEDPATSDIMSFSDFLASPMAEKIRLERQFFFKNSNASKGNVSTENSYAKKGKLDSRAFKNDTLIYLRNLIAARILDSLLNFTSANSNSSKASKSGRSSEGLTSAEHRPISIMVTPYEGQESVDSPSSRPVFRILKGRIVSLPDIPQELIPLILDTYKPTYTEPEEIAYQDDQSDSILRNTIYKLLQNDELLNLQPVVRKPHHPIAYKVSKKSPSINYVGSLKSNQPMVKPKYSYKPSEWSLEPRCDRLTEEICLDDSDYPSSAIMSSIYKDKSRFDMMYAEIKVHESQVEGLSRQQEAAYSFDHYYGSYPQASGSNLVPRDYGPNGGFVCPSEVHYAKPHRAKNRKGEWKVVVNVGEYTQTLRMEKCLSSGTPCKYVVNQMQSTCSQVFSYHRLLVFSKEKGLHIDVFRVPTACTCYLRPEENRYNSAAASAPFLVRPSNPYEEYGGHVETAPPPLHHAENHKVNRDKKRKSFSNTLWAILGGGQQGSSLAQQPQFLDEVQKQITWTQHLKQFPHLMKQISPNQVLKQLLEEDEEDYSIRRQRVRQKQHFDHLTSGGFSSHQVPMVFPLPPPPPPPPSGISRRPMVNINPFDQKHNFAAPHDFQSNMFALSSSSEPGKVFSLTKDSGAMNKPFRPHNDSGHRNVYTIVGSQSFNRRNPFKVQPGMYPPPSENIQIPESSLLPVAPQFSSHPDNPMKTVMKPMPPPRGSNKNIVEDDDLIAAEKTVGGGIQTFIVESDADGTDNTQQDDSDSKINFSYHPILEYLNV